ncbi:hypothetical protein LCB40_12610 [Lactobacillus corticis]|uniref:Uncharacterized protein n=1 Tax=Lactobacillus corticis TaxID=2201249 RepID=A0A916QKZ5_9LACO|nr:hypothetical protein LCB40_12610 [Lactobacillus corticis]
MLIQGGPKGAPDIIENAMQASTNPELLRYNINYQDLGPIDSNSSEWSKAASAINRGNISDASNY